MRLIRSNGRVIRAGQTAVTHTGRITSRLIEESIGPPGGEASPESGAGHNDARSPGTVQPQRRRRRHNNNANANNEKATISRRGRGVGACRQRLRSSTAAGETRAFHYDGALLKCSRTGAAVDKPQSLRRPLPGEAHPARARQPNRPWRAQKADHAISAAITDNNIGRDGRGTSLGLDISFRRAMHPDPFEWRYRLDCIGTLSDAR